ncbi:MAG: hypothetical protein QNL05_13275 [Gammaproteobacteria bacterium]|nr:hypothetical protein [Gammaproteobacteria bacterium]MDX2488483.1 hypothetical protein [Gammaproteobacteria bacterium]
MSLEKKKHTGLKHSLGILRNEPLHERVPTHDEEGKPLGDFMMLFPGLRDLAEAGLRQKVDILADILSQYKEVVFVDLNVPLNLLWVSIKHKPGLVLELSSYVKMHIPEAKLVGVPPEALVRKKQ